MVADGPVEGLELVLARTPPVGTEEGVRAEAEVGHGHDVGHEDRVASCVPLFVPPRPLLECIGTSVVGVVEVKSRLQLER
jgi:hypothetical protein